MKDPKLDGIASGQNRRTLRKSGLTKTMVESDELNRVGVALRGDFPSGKMKRVSRSETDWMRSREPDGRFDYRLVRRNARKSIQCELRGLTKLSCHFMIDRAVVEQSRDRTFDFDPRGRKGEMLTVLRKERS